MTSTLRRTRRRPQLSHRPSVDPFALLETPEAQAARVRLEELAAGKVIADALQVGLADPQPPASPQRSLRGKRPTGPLPAERSRLDPPPTEPAQVIDSSQAENALLEADQARAKAEMIANELREVVEAERALRAEATRRAEELGAQVSVAQAEREAAELRVKSSRTRPLSKGSTSPERTWLRRS